MFSQFFPADEQPHKEQEGVSSRILAYSPELMLMEWRFENAGQVIPPHAHYHAQLSYVAKGAATIRLCDGSEKLCVAGDAVSFAPNESHGVVTAEPDTVIMDVFNPVRLDHLANHTQG